MGFYGDFKCKEDIEELGLTVWICVWLYAGIALGQVGMEVVAAIPLGR